MENIVPNDDLIAGFETDFDKTKLDTGVRKWTWLSKTETVQTELRMM
mgnify:CR=1 FL=1